MEIPVLVVGSMDPGVRDPDYNYSTGPIYFMKKYIFIYIGNIRRNECLMVAAALIDRSGVVVLHVIKVKKEIGNLFEEFLTTQAVKFPCASIDILSE